MTNLVKVTLLPSQLITNGGLTLVNRENEIEKLKAEIFSLNLQLDKTTYTLKLFSNLCESLLKKMKRLDQDFLEIHSEHHDKFEEMDKRIEQMNLKLVKLEYEKGVSA